MKEEETGCFGYLKKAAKKNSKNTNYQFWQQNNKLKELFSNEFLDEKINYIHNNSVEAGLVNEPEHYNYSSARDYAGETGQLIVKLLQ